MGEAPSGPGYAVYIAGVPATAEEFLRRITAEGVPHALATLVLERVPCPIKRNAPLETAQRYQAMFRRAGAVVDVLPEPFVAPEPFAPVPGVDARGSFVLDVPAFSGRSQPMAAPGPVELDGEAVPFVDDRGTLELDVPAVKGLSQPLDAAFLPPAVVALDVELPDAPPPRERAPIELPPPREVVKHGRIAERLQEVFPYLRRPNTVMTLIGAAIVGWLGTTFFAFMPLLGWLLAPLFGITIQAMVFFRIIETTAYDDDELDLPDFIDAWSLWVPALRYLAIIMPVIIGFAYLGTQALYALAMGLPPWLLLLERPGFAALAAGGIMLLPLLASLTAINRSVFQAYNPVRWYASLRMMGIEYPAAAVTFYGLYVIESYAAAFLWYFLFGNVPVVGTLLLTIVAYFFLAARARVLGALCQPYVERAP